MTNSKSYEAWQNLFEKEQKGKTPESKSYQPVNGLNMLPYSEQSQIPPTSFPHIQKIFLHSFIADTSTVKWLVHQSESLNQYQIKSIFYTNNTDQQDDTLEVFENIAEVFANIASDGIVQLETDPQSKIPVLDFGAPDILSDIKECCSDSHENQGKIRIIPGTDLLWNIGLLRGWMKHQAAQAMKSTDPSPFSIYIDLQSYNTNQEDQLINLTNQFISMMVCGLHHCIWDLRNISEWQKSHFYNLLNIPEILTREGHILTDTDPIAGSGFFEELSAKVFNHLQK